MQTKNMHKYNVSDIRNRGSLLKGMESFLSHPNKKKKIVVKIPLLKIMPRIREQSEKGINHTHA